MELGCKSHFTTRFAFEVERILNTPLSLRFPNDVWCWDLEKSGVYSVRSAYKALMNDNWFASEGTSSSTTTMWKTIWGDKVLPRVKVFAWRACLEALPTRKGLSRRIAAIDASCSTCGAVEEQGLHALYWCG